MLHYGEGQRLILVWIGLKWLKMPCVKMPHEMCFLAHRGVWFERVKVEKYPIRLNSLLNYHISNHIWQHLRSKMIWKCNILIIIAQNNPEQFHDQIVLFQLLFLNLIQKHFFRVLSTSPGRFQELANILWQSKDLKGRAGKKHDATAILGLT